MNTQVTPPIEAAARKNRAIICIVASLSASGLIGRDLGRVQRGGKALLLAVIARPIPEARAAYAGRAVAADDVAVGVLADHVVEKQILGDDDVALHPQDLGDVGDAAGTAPRARGPDRDIERGSA